MELKYTLIVFGLFQLACESRECAVGFFKKNKECVDEDECATPNLCGNNAQCRNTNGSYYCFCDEGFQSKTPNFTAATTEQCQDIDECFAEPPICSGDMECMNTPGSYNCSCPRGYRETRLESACEDVDECLSSVCGDHSRCINSPGSFFCTCSPGFSLENGTCADIDECKDPDVCGTDGDCYNLPGEYGCKCHQGYSNYGNDQSKCIETVQFCE